MKSAHSVDRNDLHFHSFAMIDSKLFKATLVFLCAAALVPGIVGQFFSNTKFKSCGSNEFLCADGSNCKNWRVFCDELPNCNDGSDEKYCDNYKTRYHGGCPPSWFECKDGSCIPSNRECNSVVDCHDESDENECEYLKETTEEYLDLSESKEKDEIVLGARKAKKNLTNWFLRRRKFGTTTNKWGHQLHRTATALFFSDKEFFSSRNTTGEELSYELNLQLLSRLDSKRKLKSNELATDIHALLVTCTDPRDFHGHDLVSELRARVDSARPFELLALCNAGDVMTHQDAQRAADAFNSKHRPFATDNQAMALQALACIQSRSHFTLNGTNMTVMGQDLKRRQFENGTVDNLRTTALVLQALIATQSYQENFNFDAAMKAVLDGQKLDGSFGSLLDSYYVMPLLSGSSLLNISSSHCKRPTKTESDALSEYRNMRGERMQVRYSIRIGDEEDLRKTWTLHVPLGCSFYDVIEIVNKLDSRQKVQYNVMDGKPYVSSVNEQQDDLEMGLYWFTFVRSTNSDVEPKVVEESPADVKIAEHDELILWYRQAERLANGTHVELKD